MHMHMHITHSFMWDILIQGLYAKCHDLEKAFTFLQRCMSDRGVLPSSLTFCVMVRGLSSKGLMGRAIEVLELIVQLIGDSVMSTPEKSGTADATVSLICSWKICGTYWLWNAQTPD
ncbi:hypothetical protein Fmac_008491 [Flemingia macrophylla]|uniref:Pentatricopeptide repeat-containing protein n=1 Tax=Flemingia macrophylla TaxID=520843 RepID=A0ABD1MXK1_9FABA